MPSERHRSSPVTASGGIAVTEIDRRIMATKVKHLRRIGGGGVISIDPHHSSPLEGTLKVLSTSHVIYGSHLYATPVGKSAASPEVAPVQSTLQQILETLQGLTSRVTALEQKAENVIVLREITREEAKQEVLNYFAEHPDSYPSDAAVALHVDSGLVRDLAEELVNEGVLEG